PRSARGGPDDKAPSWSERLDALKYVPPLLKLVYETHRGYTIAILALRAVRAFVPLAVLWIGKLIIDGVIAAMGMRAAGAVVEWWHLGGLVGLELGIAVAGEGLARLSSLLESLLGDLFSNRISVRLMEHAATLDIAQYEDAETYDHLERARRQTVGRIGLVALLLSTAQDLVTLASLAAVLLVELPWLLLLLAVAVVPVSLAEVGVFMVGALIFRAGSFRQSRDLIRLILLSLSEVFEQSLYLSVLFTFFDVRPRVTSQLGARPVPMPIRRGFEFQDV